MTDPHAPAERAARTATSARETNESVTRYVITVGVSAPTNPGRVAGAWVTRLGERTRVTVFDAGECSTHRGALATIGAALAAPRAATHPLVVRCNQLAAVQAAERVRSNLTLNPIDEGLDEGEAAVARGLRAAFRVCGNVSFEHLRNDAGDPDLDAARGAATEASRKRSAA